jgi:hypothetical protein
MAQKADRDHPRSVSTTTPDASKGNSLEDQDRLFDLFLFGAESCEHFKAAATDSLTVAAR